MIFIDLYTSEMDSRPTRAIATLRSRWRCASVAPLSSLAAVCFLKEGEKGRDFFAAEALSRDTKADLLSSAPPPVVAEALQPNEEVASSGRLQLIVRPACIGADLVPQLADGATRPASAARTRVARAFCVHETLKYTRLQLVFGVDSSSSTQSSSGEPASRAPAQNAGAFLEPFHTKRMPRDHDRSSLTHG